jgi:hypothetical protein
VKGKLFLFRAIGYRIITEEDAEDFLEGYEKPEPPEEPSPIAELLSEGDAKAYYEYKRRQYEREMRFAGKTPAEALVLMDSEDMLNSVYNDYEVKDFEWDIVVDTGVTDVQDLGNGKWAINGKTIEEFEQLVKDGTI